MKNIPTFYKKIIALAFFAAILSVAGLASYSYADNYNVYTQSTSPSKDWSSVKYVGNYIYAVSSNHDDRSIYYSTDNGNSWTQTSSLHGDNEISFRSVSASRSGQHIVVGSNKGIFISHDSGSSWTYWSANDYEITAVAISDSGDYVYGVKSSGNIFRSTAGGQTWSWNEVGVSVGIPYSIACSSDCSYVAVGGNGGVAVSSNYGNSFSNTLGGNNFNGVSVSSAGDRMVAASFGQSVYTSNNYGNDWTSSMSVQGTTGYWNSVSMSDDGLKIVASQGSSGPAYTSSNGGTTWTAQSSLPSGNILGVSINPSGTYFAGASSNSYIYTAYRYIPAPGAPDLADGSDAGYSNSDNITNVRNPEIIVSCSQEGNTVELMWDNSVQASATCNGSGLATLTPDLGQSARGWYFTARETDGSLFSNESGQTSISVEYAMPQIDSGASNPTNISDQAADVSFGTNEPTTAVIEYGTVSGEYTLGNSNDFNNGLSSNHNLSISGLSADTHYYYRVTATDEAGNTAQVTSSFTTGSVAISGCTDSMASNYNASATSDDGSCSYDVYGCTDGSAINYNPSATVSDGSCTYTVPAVYFNGAQSGDWGNLNNWWADSGFSQQANVLPNSSSDVIISASVSSNTGEVPTVNTLTFNDSGNGYSFNIPITVVNGATLNGNSYLGESAALTASVTFNDSTFNQGTIIDGNANVYHPAPYPLGGTVTSGMINYFGYMFGCTDVNAGNYDGGANYEDGSCTYDVYGCTDPAANNYNASANMDDASCEYPPEVPGLIDLITESDSGVSSTDNLTNDSTPTFTSLCNGNNNDVVFDLRTNDGTTLHTYQVSCMGGEATFNTGVVTTLYDNTYYVIARSYDNNSISYSSYTDPLYFTIDATADDVSSYTLAIASGYDTGYDNTDNLVNDQPVFTGTCANDNTIEIVRNGSVVSTSPVTCSNGTFLADNVAYEYTSGSYGYTFTYTQTDQAGNESTSGGLSVTIDMDAPTSASGPSVSNNYPTSVDIGWTTNTSANRVVKYDTFTSYIMSGILGQEQGNYDVYGTESIPMTLTNLTADTTYVYRIVYTDMAGNTTESGDYDFTTPADVVSGCTDASAFNYNDLANTDDGSCIAVVNGCTDGAAQNYNGDANTDDGTCEYGVSGCTDGTANNYNPSADEDDGSCTYDGCTDPTAYNYNVSANFDNGSCEYLPGTLNAPGFATSSDSGYSDTDRITNATSLTFTIDDCDGASGNIVKLYANGSDLDAIATCTGTGTTITIPTSAVSEGEINSDYAFYVTQTGNVGESLPGPTTTVYIRQTGPEITSPSSSNQAETTTTITWDTNTLANSQVEYGLDTNYGNLEENASYVSSHEINLSNLSPNTTYYYRIISTDEAGNTTTSSDYTFDTLTSIPSSPVLSTESDTGVLGDNITNQASPTFIVEGCVNGATVQLYVDGVADNTAYCLDGSTLLIPSADLSEGEHSVQTTQIYNNITSQLSDPRSLTIDTTPASQTSISTSGVASTTANVVVATNDNAIVSVQYGLSTEYGSVSEQVSAEDYTTSHTVRLSGLTANTLYHYRAVSTDEAGNETVSSDSTFTTTSAGSNFGGGDNNEGGNGGGGNGGGGNDEPPAQNVSIPSSPTLSPSSDLGQSNSDNLTSDTTPTLQGSGTNPSATIKIYENDNLVGSTVSSVDGDWSYTTSALGEGEHTFVVTQTVGLNESSQSSGLTITIDTTAPTATLSSESDDTLSGAFNVNLFFSDDVYGLSLNDIATLNATLSDLVQINPSTYSFIATPNTNGAITLKLNDSTVFDIAGNANALSSNILSRTASSTSPTSESRTDDSSGGFSTVQSSSGQGSSGSTGASGETSSGSSGIKNQSLFSKVIGAIKDIFFGSDKDEIFKDGKNNSANNDAGTSVGPKTQTGLLIQKQVFVTEQGTPFVFTKTLSVGGTGANSTGTGAGLGNNVANNTDAKKLQVFLNSTGFAVAKKGDGSIGKETNKFGPATKNALIKFQKAVGITPATGVFGPATRAKVNQIIRSIVK